jgi:hypothetical protein
MAFLATSKQQRHASLAACIAATLLSASCAGTTSEDVQGDDSHEADAQEPMATQAVLDQQMLSAALDEQKSLEALGVSLKTRAWLRADAYVANYQNADGAFLGTQRVGPSSLMQGIVLPTVEEGERFDDFEKRNNTVGSMHVAELSKDVLWFKPEQKQLEQVGQPGNDGNVAVTSAALSDLELVAQALAACDKMARTSCNDPVGYHESFERLPLSVFGWAVTFGRALTQFGGGGAGTGSGIDFGSARGDAAFSAVCARSVTATFNFQVSRPRFNIMSVEKFSTTVAPLNFFGLVIGEGWHDSECSGPACNYVVEFNQANMSFQVSPGENVQTFCGHITQQDNIFYSNGCNLLFRTNCPDFVFPRSFSSQSVVN